MSNNFQQACQVMPGGVNSPVRAFRGVGGEPLFIARAQGAYLYDEAGKAYVDYIGSWGPMIAGHAHPDIIAAITAAAADGLSFGAPTVAETKFANTLCQLMPSLAMVRLVSSGTEAAMSAIRLARGFTGKQKILKFNGCYHGHSDGLLVKAGSGALTLGIPDSAGVPASYAMHTLVAEYNDIASVSALFAQHGDDIAAIIVEPIAGNMNCILPQADFLPALRDLCTRYASLLIFDEVMTGFRVALGGAQAFYNITPDLTVLGKIIGGGLPLAAFGGRRDIMQCLAPLGAVYQAGTLSGNPLAVAAGLATLKLIQQPHFYTQLQAQTLTLIEGLRARAARHHIPFFAQSVTGMFGLFFTTQTQIQTFADLNQNNLAAFRYFFHAMLARGIYWAPSAFEAGFLSHCHDPSVIQQTLAASEEVFAEMAKHCV